MEMKLYLPLLGLVLIAFNVAAYTAVNDTISIISSAAAQLYAGMLESEPVMIIFFGAMLVSLGGLFRKGLAEN